MGVTPPVARQNTRITAAKQSVSEDEACKIKECLKNYGTILSDVSPNYHYDPDLNAQPVGNGSYQINIRLNKQIPNFIPAEGKKIRVRYKGCQFLCTNCYRAHSRKNCKNSN